MIKEQIAGERSCSKRISRGKAIEDSRRHDILFCNKLASYHIQAVFTFDARGSSVPSIVFARVQILLIVPASGEQDRIWANFRLCFTRSFHPSRVWNSSEASIRPNNFLGVDCIHD